MPTGLTFFLSLLATAGLFAGLYFAVTALVEGKRFKARPRFGLAKGTEPGTIRFWIQWDPTQFLVQLYRIRFSHVSPQETNQEGMFSVSYEPPQKEPFVQVIELPADIRKLVESAKPGSRSLFTIDFKTAEGLSMNTEMTVEKFKKHYDGVIGSVPKTITNQLAKVAADHPAVMTLEYNELVARNQRLKTLEAAMKAKQAKAAAAAPKPATAAPAPAAPKPEGTTPSGGQSTATNTDATNTEQPQDKAPTKSVREVVSANKTKTTTKNVEG